MRIRDELNERAIIIERECIQEGEYLSELAQNAMLLAAVQIDAATYAGLAVDGYYTHTAEHFAWLRKRISALRAELESLGVDAVSRGQYLDELFDYATSYESDWGAAIIIADYLLQHGHRIQYCTVEEGLFISTGYGSHEDH